MNQLYRLRRLVLVIALVTSGLDPVVAQATPITYELLPASTITPVAGLTPTGPTEALSGTFQWVGPDTHGGFDAVALFFSSASFSITLNQTAFNDLETLFFPHGELLDFAEVVDLTGLTIGLGDLRGEGTYLPLGPFMPSSGPTLLSLPLLHIGPHNGGLFAAELSFSAFSVPEPVSAPESESTLTFFFVGLAALLLVARSQKFPSSN